MFLFEREGVWPIPFATGRPGFCSSFLWYHCFPEYIHFCSFFLFSWIASLLRYTYTRETGHTEMLHSLVAIHGSSGRSGHMGFWGWSGERYFFLGNGVYGWDCTSSSRQIWHFTGFTFHSAIQTAVSNTYRQRLAPEIKWRSRPELCWLFLVAASRK